jgi:Uma2 family endonuclease
MTPVSISPPAMETLADLHERLGSIPLERIRLHPAPGTAKEEDVLSRPDGVKRLCELVDGVLVEKPMGYYESRLGAVLIYFLECYLEEHDLGIILGESGTVRLEPGLVRIPDVAFFPWKRFPRRKLPAEPIPDLVPDLAVEILSATNTPKEMARKRREYFAGGCRLVWEVFPDTHIVLVYTSPEKFAELIEKDVIDGRPVLPGFALNIRDWFARAGQKSTR